MNDHSHHSIYRFTTVVDSWSFLLGKRKSIYPQYWIYVKFYLLSKYALFSFFLSFFFFCYCKHSYFLFQSHPISFSWFKGMKVAQWNSISKYFLKFGERRLISICDNAANRPDIWRYNDHLAKFEQKRLSAFLRVKPIKGEVRLRLEKMQVPESTFELLESVIPKIETKLPFSKKL